ncbi:Polyadenylate-binding protein 2 [Conglomerata obtusa]
MLTESSSDSDIKRLKELQMKQDSQTEPKDENTIVIKNIEFNTTRFDINTFFKSCGQIKNIVFPSSKKGPCVVNVEFVNKQSVDLAISLNNTIFKGKAINITKKLLAKRINKKIIR